MTKLIKGEYLYKEGDKLREKKERNKKRKLAVKQSIFNTDKTHFIHIRKRYIQKYGKLLGTLIYFFNKKILNKPDPIKICGETHIHDLELLTTDALVNSKDTIYTILSLSRNYIGIDEETDRQIAETLYLLRRAPDLLDRINKLKMSIEDNYNEQK